ncbi:MAG: hypothetical protein U0X40_11805 [Ferruginibacter sp.]
MTELLVNTENYRFDTVASQKEAIDKMLEDQKDNLFNLAEHIINNGLNPNDRIEVVASHHDKTKFIVLEGNRRTITLKLLNNPDLIEGSKFSKLKKKFKKLHDSNKTKLIKEVDCLVYNDPKEADTWIGLKHGYGTPGVYTDNWGSLQKQRFSERTEGKTSTSLQVINLIKKSPDIPADIKSNVEKIKTTNLDRLIDDPEVRNFLGIEIYNGVIQSTTDENEVLKGIIQVIKDILNPKFTVNKIYTKQDRRDYLNKFPKASKPNITKKASKPWQFNSTGAPQPVSAPAPKPKPNPKDRNTLLPKSCAIKISKPKVNTIYHELLKLNVTKFTNATGVLFRVFVELSVDSYIEEYSLASTPSAAKSGMNFQQKMNVVANHLETKKLADAAICKGIKAAIKDSNDILGIDTWHAYVHNNKFSPKPNNLIITWDNMQDFMIILWNNIK